MTVAFGRIRIKLRKATVSFAIVVYPHVSTRLLPPQFDRFSRTSVLRIFTEICR
jgi:hypothetical protein